MQTPFPTPQANPMPAIGPPTGQNPLNLLLIKLLQGLLQSHGGAPLPNANAPMGIEDILKLLGTQGSPGPQMPVRLNPVSTPPMMPPQPMTPAPMSAPFGGMPRA